MLYRQAIRATKRFAGDFEIGSTYNPTRHPDIFRDYPICDTVNDVNPSSGLPPYSRLPVALYRADQVRELDRIAIEDLGIPGIELMNRAGAAAYAVLRERWPAVERLVVLCGGGNNGGDGYVVARMALESGIAVKVCTPPDLKPLKGDALTAQAAWREAGGATERFRESALDSAEVVIDGLLGTGLERAVTGAYAEIIAAVNRADRPVLALDIPSGLSAATGMPLGLALRAQTTVTIAGLNRGLFTREGADHVGDLRFADLGITESVYQRIAPDATRIGAAEASRLLAPRRRTSHKGGNGHVLVIGGDSGMSGAVRMAAEAAARVGAGLVSVATRASHAAWITLDRPEIMSHGVEDGAALRPLLGRASVVVVGPGLGQGEWGKTMLKGVIDSGKAMLVDADALNLLAADPRRGDCWILTPHPGEAARLLGCSVPDIQKDRFTAVHELRQRFGGVAILKGAGSLVCGDEGPVGVCCAGNPGMASGGMGDVLSGVIAGLWAQDETTPPLAARTGVYLHAVAADLAAESGERGLLATDLYPFLRQLVNPTV